MRQVQALLGLRALGRGRGRASRGATSPDRRRRLPACLPEKGQQDQEDDRHHKGENGVLEVKERDRGDARLGGIGDPEEDPIWRRIFSLKT